MLRIRRIVDEGLYNGAMAAFVRFVDTVKRISCYVFSRKS